MRGQISAIIYTKERTQFLKTGEAPKTAREEARRKFFNCKEGESKEDKLRRDPPGTRSPSQL